MVVDEFDSKLADCIDRLGDIEFYAPFFRLMDGLADIDQYMVFEFSAVGQDAVCRLAHNVDNPDLGVKLASMYTQGGFLQDDLLQQLQQQMLADPETTACQILAKRTLPAVYRNRFFNVPHFDSKFSILLADRLSGHLFYINFYSQNDTAFIEQVAEQLHLRRELIGAVLLKHFRLERSRRGALQNLLVAGLSEREAQICELLLKGHTAKTIGQTLALAEATVVTYKKRAFSKLKIQRKSELLQLV